VSPHDIALLPCTRISKTRAYATLGPSSLPTVMPIPGRTLALNTKSLSNVRVRVCNRWGALAGSWCVLCLVGEAVPVE